MTLVAVWRHSPGRIHAIADTRISSGPGSVYTDHGPKILPLAVVCRKPGPSGFIDSEMYRREFGFAYAGSTLTALSSHALANILCSNLGGLDGSPAPSLDETAYAVATISYQYSSEIGVTGGPGSLFSSILFGHCPRTQHPLAFEMRPQLGTNGLELKLDKHILDESKVVVVGDQPQVLQNLIKEIRSEATQEIVVADAPMIALKRLISEGQIGSVGGSVQQAWSYGSKLEVVATMEPITPQPPSTRNAGLFVLGFDTFDMQTIGNYRIILTGRM